MISEEENKYNVLDTLIKENRSFAIYRIPGEEHPHFVMQTSGSTRLLYNIEELNEQSGFVIAPFHITKECPIVLIRPDSHEIPSIQKVSEFSPEVHKALSENNQGKQDYIHTFHTFIESLRSKQFDKLVLSRCLTLKRESHFSPAHSFHVACQRYIRSYVYLCHTPETGTWLGGTPEILLAGQAGQWHTVALAGTQLLKNGELPTDWDEKNCREQQLVSGYIQEQLQSLGIHSEMHGPYTARAGELSHLKSDFHFSLPNQSQLGDLLKQLHPTPAVCGLPKEEAYQFILRHEGYDRRYYSGFIGWLNPTEATGLYVNLRCMHIKADSLTLYAGGGLLSSSLPEEEWQETEDKLQTMHVLCK